jgi:hypothetical protein
MNDAELIEIFQREVVETPDLYAPMKIGDFKADYQFENSKGRLRQAPALVELRWRGNVSRFSLTPKGQATPKQIHNILVHGRGQLEFSDLCAEPALLVPHLSDGIAHELEQYGVSGFDLNGNYIILTAGLVAIRFDQPNAYPQSRDIKKVYSYNSSIVGRFLLVENRVFEQVNEIYEGIQKRGGGISLSTVSKVLKGLDEEMIISKKRGEIRLLQSEKLLDRLQDGYREPRTGRRIELKLPEGEAARLLSDALGTENWVWSGESSAGAYAATTPARVRTAYIPKLATAMDALGQFEDSRFYNCILEQTDDDYVYFDRREEWASPVEAYLALSQMDKREREVARSIRQNVILNSSHPETPD